MHVLINATSARLGGGITVLRNLLPALCAADGGRHRYTVVARSEVRPLLAAGLRSGDAERLAFHTPPLGEAIAGRLVWEQLALPVQAALGRADVLFSPANLAVAASPVPQVLVVQNLAPFDPDVVSRYGPRVRLRLQLLRELGIASARRARKVVFISDYARAQLAPLFGLSNGRASMVHLGRDTAFNPEAKERAPALLQQLGVRPPYLLSVGQFYRYKNLVELVVAFSRARASLPASVNLVLAGEEHERPVADAVRAAIAREGLEGRVQLVGQVAYESLPPLYAAASLFLFPSSCENFPNILVEGLSSGVPVLCSRLGPMPEVAGDGADYFDPFDVDEMSACITRLFPDDARQQQLRARGVLRAARYSWDACARGMLSALEEAAS